MTWILPLDKAKELFRRVGAANDYDDASLAVPAFFVAMELHATNAASATYVREAQKMNLRFMFQPHMVACSQSFKATVRGLYDSPAARESIFTAWISLFTTDKDLGDRLRQRLDKALANAVGYLDTGYSLLEDRICAIRRHAAKCDYSLVSMLVDARTMEDAMLEDKQSLVDVVSLSPWDPTVFITPQYAALSSTLAGQAKTACFMATYAETVTRIWANIVAEPGTPSWQTAHQRLTATVNPLRQATQALIASHKASPPQLNAWVLCPDGPRMTVRPSVGMSRPPLDDIPAMMPIINTNGIPMLSPDVKSTPITTAKGPTATGTIKPAEQPALPAPASMAKVTLPSLSTLLSKASLSSLASSGPTAPLAVPSKENVSSSVAPLGNPSPSALAAPLAVPSKENPPSGAAPPSNLSSSSSSSSAVVPALFTFSAGTPPTSVRSRSPTPSVTPPVVRELHFERWHIRDAKNWTACHYGSECHAHPPTSSSMSRVIYDATGWCTFFCRKHMPIEIAPRSCINCTHTVPQAEARLRQFNNAVLWFCVRCLTLAETEAQLAADPAAEKRPLPDAKRVKV